MKLRHFALSITLVLSLIWFVGYPALAQFQEDNTEVALSLCFDGKGYVIHDSFCAGLEKPEGGDLNSFHWASFMGTKAELKHIRRQNPTGMPNF
jgi:hypothetical protein